MKVIKEDSTEDKTFDDFTFKRPEMKRFGETMDFKPERGFADSAIDSDFQARGKRKPFENNFYEQSMSQSMFKNKRTPVSQERIDKINLFSGENIGIFEDNMKEATDAPKMYIWERLLNDELQYIIAQPPKNAFEEMIQLTEEGKLWKFPISVKNSIK